MTALQRFAGSLALALLIPALNVLSFATDPAIQIQYNSSILNVEINHPSALSAVLSALCEKVALQCNGTDKAADITVAPVVLKGTWDHVLLKLMEGSGLNYAATNPSAGYKGSLLIQGPALAIPKQAGLSPETPATAAFLPPSDDTQSPENQSETTPEVKQGITNSTPVSTASAAADRQGAGSAVMNAAVGMMMGSPLTSELSPNSDSPQEQQPAFLPFPDEHGRPIPASNEPAQFLPFPDEKGHLIPVGSGPTGSPFPLQPSPPHR